MLTIAVDGDNNRIQIEEAKSKYDYFCPSCGKPLVIRKGEIRRHHFAHAPNERCTDSWQESYDMSDWHYVWQSCYPKQNQEILCKVDSINHRADVMLGRTVVEFQHSPMSTETFNNRNAFYDGLGYKVIWIFDLRNDYAEHILSEKGNNAYAWSKPKRTFNLYDVQCGTIDLFFQITENEIIKVNDISATNGFEEFSAAGKLNKTGFLNYTGLINGFCALPDKSSIEYNTEYLEFKKKYNIDLNPHQERAVQAVNGANLLLAVPGSGKTTVLIARLGYMIYCKNIAPESILALSYNVAAAAEMKTRFINTFGTAFQHRLEIRAINSLCYKIIQEYASKRPNPPFTLITDENKKVLLKRIFKSVTNEYALDSDLKEMEVAFTYIKNFMLTENEIKTASFPIKQIPEMYKIYVKSLEAQKEMDFDDQMRYAKRILENNPPLLRKYRNTFKYICVDEAQDTSKLQHAIISMLADGNNIFMVGDEDQSIYAFRAAYPQALLNFKNNYTNPYILRMENNYRSTEDIVAKADAFISRNIKRFKKKIVSTRGKGKAVERIDCETRSKQYDYLISDAKESPSDTAILYRNNDSMIPLADRFIKNNIPYRTDIKDSLLFFSNRIVRDIRAFIRFAYNQFDYEAFNEIAYKCRLYFKKGDYEWAVKRSKRDKIPITVGLINQKEEYGKRYNKDIQKARSFKDTIDRLPSLNANQDIKAIMNMGYSEYLREKDLDDSKLDILLELSVGVPDLKSLSSKLDSLPDQIKNHNSNDPNAIKLSTIHSSKGLEYQRVYILDAFDGSLPQIDQITASLNESNMEKYQEERRLFYVAMTSAKDELYLLAVKNKNSSFVDEVLPKPRTIQFSSISDRSLAKYIDQSYGYRYDKTTPKVILSGAGYHSSSERESNFPVDISKYKVGVRIRHLAYGEGIITNIRDLQGERKAHIIDVDFDAGASRSFELEILIKAGSISVL